MSRYHNGSWILAATLLAAGCTLNPVTHSPEVALTSVAQERESGAEMSKVVNEQMGLSGSPALRAYVDTLGARLAARSPRQDVSYKFSIVDMAEPNAFALPGGYIYVSRGLLALANSEDELANVIGHEIGHVAARHHVRQQTTSALTSPFRLATGLAGAVTGIVAPPLGRAISGAGDLATGAVIAHYSRDQEREADEIGMQLSADAGWDPAAMSAFLTALAAEEVLVAGKTRETSFLDSHPATPERIEQTAGDAHRFTTVAHAPVADDQGAFFAELDGMLVGNDPAEGVFHDGRFVHPRLGFSVRFPEGWKTRNSRVFAAAAAPEGAALSLLEALGKSDDPLQGAASVSKKMGFSLQDVERTEVAGLPAAHFRAQAQTREGPAVVDLTWIAYNEMIYQLTGVMSLQRFSTEGATLQAIAASFRPLAAAERASVSETRLRVVRAREGETLRELLGRSSSAWAPAKASVANAMKPDTVLVAGQPIKIAVRQPYSDSGR